MFMNFHIFCLEFKYNPSKLLKELIFQSLSCGKNVDIYYENVA